MEHPVPRAITAPPIPELHPTKTLHPGTSPCHMYLPQVSLIGDAQVAPPRQDLPSGLVHLRWVHRGCAVAGVWTQGWGYHGLSPPPPSSLFGPRRPDAPNTVRLSPSSSVLTGPCPPTASLPDGALRRLGSGTKFSYRFTTARGAQGRGQSRGLGAPAGLPLVVVAWQCRRAGARW
jgi:hypothetical protein